MRPVGITLLTVYTISGKDGTGIMLYWKKEIFWGDFMKEDRLCLIPYPKRVIRTGGWCESAGNLVVKEQQEENSPERYRLEITQKGILLCGMPAGIFYGKETLRQLRDQFGDRLPCMIILDAPEFSYRGFMLDSSRHFLPVEDIKRLLDAAALLKLNKFHWHLVDDQGWRVEIRKYPKLTETGAKRKRAEFARLSVTEPEETHDFFTQEEIREIVDYAGKRFIDVVPELEIPGHESALLAAYPEYGCEGTDPADRRVQITGGIFRDILCAGREETASFLKDILDEYMELFPYSYLHLGGDEAVKEHWRSCPLCQNKMRELGLPDENALQQWLVRTMAEYLEEKGRHAVVWNDVLRGEKLSSSVAVQVWLGDRDLVREFTKRGGRIIQSSTEACYLDYPYSSIDVRKMLDFDPVPDYLKQNAQQVWGMECPLWTERVPDLERAAYLLFPRLPAMAETAWTGGKATSGLGSVSDENREKGDGAQEELRNEEQKKDDRYQSFRDRYRILQRELLELGLSGAPEKYWNMTPEDAAEDRREWEEMGNTPFLTDFRREEEELLERERAVYGRF